MDMNKEKSEMQMKMNLQNIQVEADKKVATTKERMQNEANNQINEALKDMNDKFERNKLAYESE